jgi:hypothetical protein
MNIFLNAQIMTPAFPVCEQMVLKTGLAPTMLFHYNTFCMHFKGQIAAVGCMVWCQKNFNFHWDGGWGQSNPFMYKSVITSTGLKFLQGDIKSFSISIFIDGLDTSANKKRKTVTFLVIFFHFSFCQAHFLFKRNAYSGEISLKISDYFDYRDIT